MALALILTGKEETSQGTIESYQLQIGAKLYLTTYHPSYERSHFNEEVSDLFARIILEERSPLEIGVLNGLKINPQIGYHEKILKLEDELLTPFAEKVTAKSKKGTPSIMYGPSLN